VRPEEQNVATRKGRARGGMLSVFTHLTLIMNDHQGERQMVQVIYERCAAIDVHKKTAVTTILISDADGSVQEQTQTFSSMTADLLALDDWLRIHRVEVIAMESTGVFWRPIFNLLEEGRTIILVNAQHMKAVPGRKTDVKDSQWLADLLRHGLLQASFIPPKPVRDLRDLMRYRKTLVQQRADEVNRLQKVLETANLKLASVATDVLGKSGRSMLDALLGGQNDPEILAELARGRMRSKIADLRKALDGRVHPHHQVLLTRILAHIDFLEESLAQLQKEMEQYLTPFDEAVKLVVSVVGIGEMAAGSLIAEIGTDMTRFASDKHLASWAGLSPGNKQSGGKRLSGKTTKGKPYLRAILYEVAWAISHTRNNYLSAFYHRIVRRLGKNKAITALAHKVLVILYHILRTKKPYSDLGADYFDQKDQGRIQRHHVSRLEQLGYMVTLIPKEVA